jgi:hypothetical protein
MTNRSCNTDLVDQGVGANTLVRRWRVTSSGIRKALAGIRDPRLRAEIQRLIDAYWTGKAAEWPTLPAGRSEALAAVCEELLRQFDDDQAGAAEIRLVVHKRDELAAESASDPGQQSNPAAHQEDEELVWELQRLIASSGGTIADVALALEQRGDEVDRKARRLLHDEVLAIDVDLAALKTLLSDSVDWDTECKRLLADEVPPFEDPIADEYDCDEDD